MCVIECVSVRLDAYTPEPPPFASSYPGGGGEDGAAEGGGAEAASHAAGAVGSSGSDGGTGSESGATQGRTHSATGSALGFVSGGRTGSSFSSVSIPSFIAFLFLLLFFHQIYMYETMNLLIMRRYLYTCIMLSFSFLTFTDLQ